MKNVLLVCVIILVFGGVLTYQLLQLGQVECYLCLDFKENSHCATAKGPDENAALMEAHQNVCAILASGVTEALACQRTQAKNFQCKKIQD